MLTDPLWIAYTALILALVAVALGVVVGLRGEITRDILHRLIDTLHRSGAPVNASSNGAHRERCGAATVAAPLAPAEDPSRPLAGPPQVLTADGAVATGDWLQHYARPGVTWPGVVVEFYGRLERVPEVISYFHAADVPRVRQHFAGLAVKITRKGITVGDREALRVAHQGVRNRRGEPITGPILDTVVNTLVAVLRDNGVPSAALQDLGRMLAEADLRSVLIVEPART